MESFNSNTGGYLVYKRKRKCTSSEESKSYPTEVMSVNSNTSKAKADSHTPARAVAGDGPKVMLESGKNGMEYHGGAAVSDAHIGSTMVQQTPKGVERDKLLILRDVLQKSVEESDKSKQCNNEESDNVQQLVPVYTPSGLALKEKYARLRARQKERLRLRITSKGHLSSSRLAGPKQSSGLQIGKWRGGDAHCSSLKTLKGKDIIIPNASLHKMNGSASGFKSSTSFHENMDPMTSRRPRGVLKRKIGTNDWSELELDALWVGVRRHGKGHWETMLADPALRCLKNRTPADLSTRWNKELLKISPFPKPTSTLLPTISVRNGGTHLAPRAPQGPLNINLEPMVAELMLQTLYQRADLNMNMRLIRMNALLTMMRNRFPTGANPALLLGGHVQLPRVWEGQNAADDHPTVTSEGETSEWSETTLSD